MAVYKRTYRPYEGPLTAERWRFLVLPRYAFHEVFEARALLAFFVLCCVPFLIEVAAVYIANNQAVRVLLRIQDQAHPVTPDFFVSTLTIQGFLAFLLTAWVSPILVSPDLVNGALPLYLSRPFSRAEYTLGKATVLLTLLSLVTWVPQLTIFALQASLAGGDWLRANLRIPLAIFAGSWLWILVLTLLGLALSSWIRWRIVASGALFGIFFTGGAFGEMWWAVLRNSWGRLLNLSYLIGLVWRELFGANAFFRQRQASDLPVSLALLALLTVCLFSLAVLNRRLRAREVVS